MLYHIALTCQSGSRAYSLFDALSTRYKDCYPALTPFAYGETLRGQGFVVAEWHGELDGSVLEQLRTDPRTLDLCTYAVPFFSPETSEHENGTDEELARLYGPARSWERENGQ